MQIASNDGEGPGRITWQGRAARSGHLFRRRVVIVPGGPVLIEGPVEIVLAGGAKVVSDRFMVAICLCRRSRRFPFCDTSHRHRARTCRDHRD